MKKLLLLGVIILCWGCNHTTPYETIKYAEPNWTSDGKIIFVKDYSFWKETSGPFSNGNLSDEREELTICEINNDGTGLKEILKVAEAEGYRWCLYGLGTSSAGEWIAFCRMIGDNSYIYVLKRNGDSLRQICVGRYPDFSPDASKIVYEKPNQGIWIINRDGTGDHKITATGNTPAWSPDSVKIAYNIEDKIFITDTSGNNIDSLRKFIYLSDWGPLDSNAIIVADWKLNKSVVLYLTTSFEDTLAISVSKWSPLGDKFIAYDGSYYISTRDSTTKWYLKP